MGLTNGLATVEAVWLLLLYVLPAALLLALVVLIGRWLTRRDAIFVGTEPGDGDPEEHHEPPQ